MLQQKREVAEIRVEALSIRELLDGATRNARGEIGRKCWPTWSRARQINEIARVFTGDRNPTWNLFEEVLLLAADEVIQHLAEQRGWKVTIERDGAAQSDPVLIAAIRRIKADLGHVERRIGPIRKE